MAKTEYANMKHHFDKLVTCAHPRNTGLEGLRSVYENMFNRKINTQDVYGDFLKVSTNPIKEIISLVGPTQGADDDILPTGLIGTNESNIFYVNSFDNGIYKGVANTYTGINYIEGVFQSMRDIVSFDTLFRSESEARVNPYLELLYAYPLYFTYHHIKECVPEFFDEKNFIRIIEKYYDLDDVLELFKSLKENEYTDDAEKIYCIMTCNYTRDIL